jgi:multiple sugar transport system permease protein
VSVRKSEARAGVLFAMPWLLGFLIFLGAPLVASVYYSFCEFSVLKPPIFIGLDNYRDMIHDPILWTTLYNTAYFTIPALFFGTFASIAMALLLNAKVKGQAFYRTFFYLPSLVPPVASAMLWMWMFNGENGLINIALAKLGGWACWVLELVHIKPPTWLVDIGPAWLSDPLWSKPALILMSLWGAGNAMVIYLASLQDVPTELVEACELDGANFWGKLWNVTIPMISPVILFNSIMLLIGSLQKFTDVYILFPQGAPAQSTYFYIPYLFDNAFVYHKFGYACAMGWFLFVIILVLTLVTLKISEKRVYYGGD